MADQLESLVLRTLQETGDIADSGIFAKEIGVNDHNELVGVLKSLEAYAMIDLEVRLLENMLQKETHWQPSDCTSDPVCTHLCRRFPISRII